VGTSNQAQDDSIASPNLFDAWPKAVRLLVPRSLDVKSMKPTCQISISLPLSLAFCLAGLVAQDSNPQPTEFLTGSELETQNELAISAWWSKAELGNRLTAFSKSQRVGLFLDRRVNPQLPIELGLKDRTTEQVLWGVADQQNLGICRIADYYYFGPAATTAVLPTVVDELTGESVRRRKQHSVDWNQRVKLSMPPVVEPQWLLQQLAEEHKFEILGLDTLPYDTWAQFDLPATSLAITVQTLLTGFGKTYQRNSTGDQITIVDLSKLDSVKRNFSTPAGLSVREFKALVGTLEQQFPDLNFRYRSKRLTVTGDPEELARLEICLVAAQQARGIETGIKTYTLASTTEFRGSILKTIGQQTSREIQFPPEYQSVLNDRIKIEAKNNSLEELLFKVLSGTDLEARLAPGKLIIEPK
jgi:hypothetical protein